MAINEIVGIDYENIKASQVSTHSNTERNCHIEADGEVVNVKIREMTYIFPKTEIRRLIECLYTS